MRTVRRLAIWGAAAVVALTIAVLAGLFGGRLTALGCGARWRAMPTRSSQPPRNSSLARPRPKPRPAGWWKASAILATDRERIVARIGIAGTQHRRPHRLDQTADVKPAASVATRSFAAPASGNAGRPLRHRRRRARRPYRPPRSPAAAGPRRSNPRRRPLSEPAAPAERGRGAQGRTRHRYRRRGQFRGTSRAVGVRDQGQCRSVRRASPRGRGAREQPHQDAELRLIVGRCKTPKRPPGSAPRLRRHAATVSRCRSKVSALAQGDAAAGALRPSASRRRRRSQRRPRLARVLEVLDRFGRSVERLSPADAARHSAACRPRLFCPSARQVNWLLIVGFLALGQALYLRYLAIEHAPVSLACQGGLKTWLCATFRLTIALYNHSVFGWVALAAALLNLIRPSIVLVFGRARRRRVRAGAAQCQPRGARGRASDAQPGASRACSRVSASASSAGAEPQRLPVGERLVEDDVDAPQPRASPPPRSRPPDAAPAAAPPSARPAATAPRRRSAAQTENRGSADRTPGRAPPAPTARRARSGSRQARARADRAGAARRDRARRKVGIAPPARQRRGASDRRHQRERRPGQRSRPVADGEAFERHVRQRPADQCPAHERHGGDPQPQAEPRRQRLRRRASQRGGEYKRRQIPRRPPPASASAGDWRPRAPQANFGCRR